MLHNWHLIPCFNIVSEQWNEERIQIVLEDLKTKVDKRLDFTLINKYIIIMYIFVCVVRILHILISNITLTTVILILVLY